MIVDLLNLKKDMSWSDISAMIKELSNSIKNKEEVLIRCCSIEEADVWATAIKDNYRVTPLVITFKNGYAMVVV